MTPSVIPTYEIDSIEMSDHNKYRRQCVGRVHRGGHDLNILDTTQLLRTRSSNRLILIIEYRRWRRFGIAFKNLYSSVSETRIFMIAQ